MSILDEIFERINGEEISELALDLAGIRGPVGHEEEVGEKVFQWLKRHNIPARKQLVAGTRVNVIGCLKGAGGGRSLAFNSHMDTLFRFRGEAQTGKENIDGYRAWRDGERLYGLATLNDRGPLAAFLIAAKAIQEASVTLKGDLVLTSVVGEIGSAPVEEYEGPEYLGKGVGTRMAVTHGPHVDYALVAETTDFGLSWVECGVAYVKITVRGEAIYTPRLRVKPGTGLAGHPNAVIRMARVVETLAGWAEEYPEKHAVDTPCGIVRPKINVGAIRGGAPCRPSETADSCSIYVDIWRAPGVTLGESVRELWQVLDTTGIPLSMEVYLNRNGFIGQGVGPLVDAVSSSYKDMSGAGVPAVSEDITSMWRDTNIYNEMGIPAITFGPTRHSDVNKKQKYLTISDLVLAAKIYSRVALDICGFIE